MVSWQNAIQAKGMFFIDQYNIGGVLFIICYVCDIIETLGDIGRMKKPYLVTVIIPLIWGMIATALAIVSFVSFVMNGDESTGLWAVGIMIAWLVAGLGPIIIAISSYTNLSKKE